ncbi:MAG: hypothetical protein U5O39_13590 [Gammaproteobacteria bacterium]|nr:hypothetical protein [Gammaproteobacteria bacterium]
MNLCWTRVSATQFAIYMAWANLARSIGVGNLWRGRTDADRPAGIPDDGCDPALSVVGLAAPALRSATTSAASTPSMRHRPPHPAAAQSNSLMMLVDGFLGVAEEHPGVIAEE